MFHCHGEIFLSTRHPKDLVWFKGEKNQEKFSRYPGACLHEKIANAFKQEGVSIFGKLEHEFVLILMEAQTGRVYLVRDRFGLEALYFSVNEVKVIFRQRLWRGGALNSSKIKRYLSQWDSLEAPAEEATYYDGVYEVRPGHYTCIFPQGGKECRSYWLPQVRDTPASAEEIYAAFEKSVRRCSLPFTQVGAAVSGGLDSSAVALIYAQLRGEKIPTFTYRGFDAESKDPYYASLVNGRISSMTHIVSPLEDLYSLVEQQSRALSRPMSMLFPPAHQAALSLHARGLDAVLTGHDGDSIIGHGVAHLHSLKKQGKWLQFFEELKKYLALRGISKDPARVQAEFKYVLKRPAQWPSFLHGAFQTMGYGPSDFIHYVQEYLRKPASLFPTEQLPPPSHAFSAAINAGFPLLVEELQFWAGQNGHTHLFPFFDRELYETCLSVPEEDRFSHGRTRQPFREAVKTLLPEEIYRRYSKDDASSFSLYSAKHLLLLHKEKFMESKALWEYVDKEKFGKGVDQLFNDKIPVNLKRPLVRNLNRVMYLGIWLDTL